LPDVAVRVVAFYVIVTTDISIKATGTNVMPSVVAFIKLPDSQNLSANGNRKPLRRWRGFLFGVEATMEEEEPMKVPAYTKALANLCAFQRQLPQCFDGCHPETLYPVCKHNIAQRA